MPDTEKIEPLPPIPESTRTLVVRVDRTKDYVFVGRPSLWGNPFKSGTREQNIAAFRRYFLSRVVTDPAFRTATLVLKGKTLGCYCSPLPCHADVIAEWLDSVSSI